jgi:TetR/AcrR family transcriptional regulator, tetracycline repressor protein
MTTPGRQQLSKAAVVSQALKLADAGGLDALTIRRLAQELGVTPMALYWHFRSKEELLKAITGQVWSEINVNVDDSAPWPSKLRFLLESLVHVLRAHPAGPRLLGEHAKWGDESLRATELTLEVLMDGAGFDARHASEIARNALHTGIQLVQTDPALVPGMSEADRVEDMRQEQIRLAMLPPSTFPRLIECAAALTDCDKIDLHYQLGIDLFVAGVEALARKGPGPSASGAGDHQA